MRLSLERTEHRIPLVRSIRGGFTMIELVVVIVIIAILVTLVVAGISKVLERVDETRLVAEVNQLAQACEQFRLKYNRYPPSLIKLSERGNYIVTTNAAAGIPIDDYSVQYLQAIFPGIDLALYTSSGGTQWHDWNGNGVADSDYILQGDECLVFFLGGIPDLRATPIAPTGFCPDRTRPAKQTGPGSSREGPFYEFKGDRIVLNWSRTGTYPGDEDGKLINKIERMNQYPVYLDPFGTPYAYMVARDGGSNNYSPGVQIAANGPFIEDCHALLTIVNQNVSTSWIPYGTAIVQTNPNSPDYFAAFRPYWQSQSTVGGSPVIRFFRPDKFQIISAGRDRLFGAGGQYIERAPETSFRDVPSKRYGGPITRGNFDNVTNFTEGVMVAK